MTTRRRTRQPPAPDSPVDAAEQFKEATGVDLQADDACVAVADVLDTWRAALAFLEYEPLVDAILETQSAIRGRSVRAIPTLSSIPRRKPPSALHVLTVGHVEAFTQGMKWVHDGVGRLDRGIRWAKDTGLVPVKRTGRPREALDSALCVLMVEFWERRLGRPRLSSTHVALAAYALGVAKPTRDWRAWGERWRRLLKRARAVKPGLESPEAKVLAYARARRNS